MGYLGHRRGREIIKVEDGGGGVQELVVVVALG